MTAMLVKKYDQNILLKHQLITLALNSSLLSQKSLMREHQIFHIFGFLVAMTEEFPPILARHKATFFWQSLKSF